MEERNEQQQQVEESADTRICSGSIGRLNSAAPQAKQPISQKKLAANRANARRSTGPRTPAGKARAARNSLKHGFCAHHILRELSGGAEDGAVCEILNAGIRKHYQHQGALEEFLVEQIATEVMRYLRIIHQEQEALLTPLCFERNRLDLLLRYATSNDRRLRRLIRELERIQTARKAGSVVGDLLDLVRGTADEPAIGSG